MENGRHYTLAHEVGEGMRKQSRSMLDSRFFPSPVPMGEGITQMGLIL